MAFLLSSIFDSFLPARHPAPVRLMDMSIIWAAIIGLIIGVIAKLLMHGTGPAGCIPTALLGIGGGLFAGWLGKALGWYSEGQPAGFIASIIGAVVLLWIYKLVKNHSGRVPPP